MSEADKRGASMEPSLDRYQINFSKPQVAVELHEATDPEHLGALLGGMAVTNQAYAETVDRTRTHEVFPEKVVDSRRSAHQVAFGRLIGYRPSKGRNGTVLSVAMKPFYNPEDALHEMYGYGVLSGMGIETFDPVGVFPAQNQEHFIVVTKKRNDLMSLDRDEWVVGRKVTSETDAEVAARNNRTVVEIAELFADMHNNGVFHPDGQIKNFAVIESGKIGAIDTENLKVTHPGNIDAAALAWGDINKLLGSLICPDDKDGKVYGVGMLAHLTLPEVRAACEELVIRPYIDKLTLLAEESPQPEHGYAIAGQICDWFYDDATWPTHLIVKS